MKLFILAAFSLILPGSFALISHEEFQCAARTKGGNPDRSYHERFIGSLNAASISTKREAALYLAHATWETDGFRYTKEQLCVTNLEACRTAYPNHKGGRPDKIYYGRGMLQLTWDYNYKRASTDIYRDDRLIQNPDQVENDITIGWATAAWYWKTAVHADTSTFGATLKAINGKEECTNGKHPNNGKERFKKYKDALTCLSLPHPAESDGNCYV